MFEFVFFCFLFNEHSARLRESLLYAHIEAVSARFEDKCLPFSAEEIRFVKENVLEIQKSHEKCIAGKMCTNKIVFRYKTERRT